MRRPIVSRPVAGLVPLHGSVSPGRCRFDEGFVLVVVLLALLALTAVAHGALALARHQRLAGRAGAAVLQARLAAEAAVRSARAGLDPEQLGILRREGSLERSTLSLGPRVIGRAEVVRVRPEWIWIEGHGRAVQEDLEGDRRTGALFWSLEAKARVGDLPAGLEHGGLLSVAESGAVTGSGPVGAPGDWPEDVCAPHVEALDSLLAPRGLPATARLTLPTRVRDAPTGVERVPPLGLLDGRVLAERAGVRPAGLRIRPEPAVGPEGCRTERSTNWGSPGDPTRPCGGHRPLVVAPGDLTLTGGEGQGVLAVGGNLALAGEARYVGVVLVGGDLEVAAGARLQGAARVGGSVRAAGRIETSPCGMIRALGGAEELLHPLSAPPAGWIPLP